MIMKIKITSSFIFIFLCLFTVLKSNDMATFISSLEGKSGTLLSELLITLDKELSSILCNLDKEISAALLALKPEKNISFSKEQLEKISFLKSFNKEKYILKLKEKYVLDLKKILVSQYIFYSDSNNLNEEYIPQTNFLTSSIKLCIRKKLLSLFPEGFKFLFESIVNKDAGLALRLYSLRDKFSETSIYQKIAFTELFYFIVDNIKSILGLNIAVLIEGNFLELVTGLAKMIGFKLDQEKKNLLIEAYKNALVNTSSEEIASIKKAFIKEEKIEIFEILEYINSLFQKLMESKTESNEQIIKKIETMFEDLFEEEYFYLKYPDLVGNDTKLVYEKIGQLEEAYQQKMIKKNNSEEEKARRKFQSAIKTIICSLGISLDSIEKELIYKSEMKKKIEEIRFLVLKEKPFSSDQDDFSSGEDDTKLLEEEQRKFNQETEEYYLYIRGNIPEVKRILEIQRADKEKELKKNLIQKYFSKNPINYSLLYFFSNSNKKNKEAKNQIIEDFVRKFSNANFSITPFIKKINGRSPLFSRDFFKYNLISFFVGLALNKAFKINKKYDCSLQFILSGSIFFGTFSFSLTERRKIEKLRSMLSDLDEVVK